MKLPEKSLLSDEDGECTTWEPGPTFPVFVGESGPYTLSSVQDGPSLDAVPAEREPLLPNLDGAPTPVLSSSDKKSMCVSIATLVLSIPALIGAWCWPALVIGLIGGSASAVSRKAGHLVSFFVTLAMMILVNLFVIWSLKKRQNFKSWKRKYGPLMFTLAATPLIMADLVRHLLCDYNLWADCGMYAGGNAENLTNLTPIGWLFTIIFTYSGFICLFIGILWNADIVKKLSVIKQRWRQLRGKDVVSSPLTAPV